MNDIFMKIKQVEPAHQEPDTQWPVVGDGAIYGNMWAKVRLIATEDWEWGSLNLEFDGDGPPHDHWLSFELDGLGGLSEVMGLDPNASGLISDLETYLLQQGIAPGQPFWVEMRYSVERSPEGYLGCVEYDSEVDWGTTMVEPWSTERAASAWEALIGRK